MEMNSFPFRLLIALPVWAMCLWQCPSLTCKGPRLCNLTLLYKNRMESKIQHFGTVVRGYKVSFNIFPRRAYDPYAKKTLCFL